MTLLTGFSWWHFNSLLVTLLTGLSWRHFNSLLVTLLTGFSWWHFNSLLVILLTGFSWWHFNSLLVTLLTGLSWWHFNSLLVTLLTGLSWWHFNSLLVTLLTGFSWWHLNALLVTLLTGFSWWHFNSLLVTLLTGLSWWHFNSLLVTLVYWLGSPGNISIHCWWHYWLGSAGDISIHCWWHYRPLPFALEFGVRFPVSAFLKETKTFFSHPRVKVSIVGTLCDREVACSASDRQGLNFESCVWKTVSSHSSHHPQEVLLAQFSLYVHKGGLKPDSFHSIYYWLGYPGDISIHCWWLYWLGSLGEISIHCWCHYWLDYLGDMSMAQCHAGDTTDWALLVTFQFTAGDTTDWVLLVTLQCAAGDTRLLTGFSWARVQEAVSVSVAMVVVSNWDRDRVWAHLLVQETFSFENGLKLRSKHWNHVKVVLRWMRPSHSHSVTL